MFDTLENVYVSPPDIEQPVIYLLNMEQTHLNIDDLLLCW
jgi:hypothetical protein